MSLALWLRGGRAERGLTLEDVARITKIQVRILERLEAGFVKPSDGLPAEVFVRGFVRSFAKCCGIDEAETLRRYEACANPVAATVSQPIATAAGTTPPPVSTARARAVVEAMSDLAPRANEAMRARPFEIILVSEPTPIGHVVVSEPSVVAEVAPVVAEVAPVVAEIAAPVSAPVAAPVSAPVLAPGVAPGVAPVEVLVAAAEIAAPIATATASDVALLATEPQATKKKRKSRVGKGRGKRQVSALASGTPFEALPVVPATTAETTTEPIATEAVETTTLDVAATVAATAVDASELMAPLPPPIDMLDPLVVPAVDDEPIATVTWQPKMPPHATQPTTTASVPWRRPLGASSSTSTSRVIPSLVIDDADPESAEQELEERAAAQSSTRRSFLPPILLDREDRSARQGGLTLAVIILLIAATLTLSYLMRRPSSSGDGVTRSDATDLSIG
ncbi:MAG: helix-turn-helix domain-containing protein [Deltaproteobacteria bacterium]|nr:helix-turn-helix domain-containing protein [Deltaproteobacteria bacterium]